MPELQGELVSLRSTVAADAERLAEIFSQPAVTEWWGWWDIERVRDELIDSSDGTVILAIEADGEVIGLVQFGEEEDPEYRHANIDIAVDPACHRRGLGADAIRTVARYLFEERGHHRITIDPAASNERAIRSYERVGFKRVGVMRQYERGPDGEWHDGLLMDLLRGELR